MELWTATRPEHLTKYLILQRPPERKVSLQGPSGADSRFLGRSTDSSTLCKPILALGHGLNSRWPVAVCQSSVPAICLTSTTIERRSVGSLIRMNALVRASPSEVERKSDT